MSDNKSDNDPVVIVGIAVEAPGGVETADDFVPIPLICVVVRPAEGRSSY